LKRLKFEEKEEAAKLRKEIMEEEDAIKREERRLELERENQKRRDTKAKLDREHEERAAEIKRKEDEINRRLTARGLLSGPADRMKKEDEEMKNQILAELQSTKDIEARKIRRMLKEEEVEINMRRKFAGDEYKRSKIMEKMRSDEDKLAQIADERAKIKVKKEVRGSKGSELLNASMCDKLAPPHSSLRSLPYPFFHRIASLIADCGQRRAYRETQGPRARQEGHEQRENEGPAKVGGLDRGSHGDDQRAPWLGEQEGRYWEEEEGC